MSKMPDESTSQIGGVDRLSVPGEDELRKIINALPTIAWSARADGYCDFFNERWFEYAGIRPQEAKGWGWATVLHPDDASRVLENWRSLLQSGTPVDVEARLRRHDGEYRWFLFRANPLCNEAGDIIAWIGTTIDVEDRVRSEQALLQRERNLHQIVNAIPSAAYSTLPDGYCDFVNDRWIEYTGMPFEQAEGWGWAAAIHPDDFDILNERWQWGLSTGRPTQAECRMRRHDGVFRWFLISSRPVHDECGNTIKWYGTNIDIDDRKRAEQSLAQQERETRLIVNTIPGLVAVFNASGRPEDLNRQLLTYLGQTIEEYADWATNGTVHPDSIELHIAEMHRAFTSGEPVDFETKLRRHDGSYRWFQLRGEPVRSAEGKILRWYCLMTDIDDRKKAEEKLRRAQVELAHISRLITMGELAVSIAHEVNQPIMAIVTNAASCLSWLQQPEIDVQEAKEAAERIIQDGHRAGEIVNTIRSMARKAPPLIKPVDLVGLATEMLELLKMELSRADIKPALRASSNGIYVLGDRTQLQQVFMNLVLNSAEAIHDVQGDRRLQISISPGEKGFAEVRVQDNGPGIDANTIDRLFDPFFTTKQDGIGMGLSICRSIIEGHRGQISVYSAPSQGTVFHFTVPLA